MAIYHFTVGVVKRSQGQSAIAKAAYNARAEIQNDLTGQAHDYTRAQGLLFEGIFAPKDAPEWAKDRAQLWNEAEKAEKRKDAQLARNIELALPYEFTDEQRERLLTDFVRENFVRKGMVADVTMHAPDRCGDQRNYHAHILLTMREIGPDGFEGNKAREWNSKEQLQTWRENWERTANRYLERHGHEARIDHRTLNAQGIDQEPEEHLGPTASQLEKQGKPSENGDKNRAIRERNRSRAEYREALAALRQAEEDERNRQKILQRRVEIEAANREKIANVASRSDCGISFMLGLQSEGFILAVSSRGQFVAVSENGFEYQINKDDTKELLEDIQGYINSGLIVPTASEARTEAKETREARRQKYLEEERERAEEAAKWAAIAPTILYDRGSMASQQADALTHHKDHIKAQKAHQREEEKAKIARAIELDKSLKQRKTPNALEMFSGVTQTNAIAPELPSEKAPTRQDELQPTPQRKDPAQEQRKERFARTELSEAAMRRLQREALREIHEQSLSNRQNGQDRERWDRERERER